MTLSPGSRLGPYEILAPIGAGGMGEVWKARDTRLGREVAIKVLPEELDSDPERLRRFEREARAVSSMSHPNIVTVFEVARIESTVLIVMELVSGGTLRELIGGKALPLRKILAIAPQIADGLARAHAAGIVHRDLKPENVMVSGDGHVKILDFGLAKLTRPEQESGGTEVQPTVSMATRPGVAMGTVSYMSPEQAAGHDVDFRSDQFALGAILYEMATGQCAFRRESVPQTLTAIIEEDPDPIGSAAPKTPAPLRWVIRRCLAKEPKGRYASTEDLARELSDLRDHVSELSTSAGVPIEEPPRRPRWRAIGLAAAGLAGLAGMFLLGRNLERTRVSEPNYRQLTFNGAGIGTARFTPDGQTIVYSQQLEGKPPELFEMRIESPEARSLKLPPAQILSISRSGELAIELLRPFALSQRIAHTAYEQVVLRDPSLLAGTLARVPLTGGVPRELLEDVYWADWAPDGEDLAVIHRVGNRNRVEYPIGKPVFDMEKMFLNYPRVSNGRIVVFKDFDNMYVAAEAGPARRLEAESAWENAWCARAGEVWYTVHPPSGGTHIRAITTAGRDRLVHSLPGDYLLYDISADGRVLLGRVTESVETLGRFPGDTGERNLSYADSSLAVALSTGADMLFFNIGVTVDGDGATYLRRTDGSAPKRLRGGGITYAASPDGKWILGENWGRSYQLFLTPTGAGQSRQVDIAGVERDFTESYRMRFLPDGQRFVFTGRQPGRRPRVWVGALDGGKPRPVTPEDVRRPVLLGDGHALCARAADFEWYLYPIEGGESARVKGVLPGEEPFDSTPDGKLLYVRGADELRAGENLMTTRVYRLDPWTGRRELWKEIPPANPRTGGGISTIIPSADGNAYVYTHYRYSVELVLADGLK